MNHFTQLRNALNAGQPTDGFTFESDENGEVPAAVILETTGEALVAIAETLSDAKDDVAAVETEEQAIETATASLESMATAEAIAEVLVETKGATEEEALAIVAPAIQDAEITIDAEPGTLSDGTSLESATTEEGGAKKWWGKVKENAIKLYNLIVEALKRAKDYLAKVYERWFDGATKVQNAAKVIAAAADSSAADREGKVSVSAKQTFKGKAGAAAIKSGVEQTTNFVVSAGAEVAKLAQVDAKVKAIVAGESYTAEELKALVPGSMFSKNGALIGSTYDSTTGAFKQSTGEAVEVEAASRAEIKAIASAVEKGAAALYKNSKDAAKFADDISAKVTEAANKLKEIKETDKADDVKAKLKGLTELRRFSSAAIKAVGSGTTGAVLSSYSNALAFARESLVTGKKAA